MLGTVNYESIAQQQQRTLHKQWIKRVHKDYSYIDIMQDGYFFLLCCMVRIWTIRILESLVREKTSSSA